MFRNYCITALRNIRRDGYYSWIKIAGLGLGLGTSLVLLLYILHQLSFDNFHPEVERLYRVNQTNIWSPGGGVFSSTGPAVAFALADNYPEIESVLRVNTPGGSTVRYVRPDGNVLAFHEDSILGADSTFFSFFSFPLQQGDPATALQGKNKVVLSAEAAHRLFGDEPAVGKIIQLGDERVAVEVTGVTEPQAINAHIQFDYLLSIYTNPAIKQMEWSWIWTQVVTYVKVAPDTDIDALRLKLKKTPDQAAAATFQKLRMNYDEFIRERGAWELYLQPVQAIHLYSATIGNRIGPVGDIQNVYILGGVGLFILLIAIVNFINLSTARAANRAKEIGVKKTLGWLRRSLIVQFQVEHILLTSIAMVVGLAVMELLRLVIVPLTGIEIPLVSWQDTKIILVFFLAPALIGFIAGLYPSFYLTAFRPAQVLKGKMASGFHSSLLRNSLVVFQFTISIALMSATLIIFNQLQYFHSRSLGFEKENLLIINHAEKLGNQLESFRDEISAFEGVQQVSLSTDIRGGFEDIFMREGDEMKMPISQYKVDEYFFDATKIPLVAGRSFDDRVGDKNKVIINETTARLFGWTPEEALAKRILYVGDDIGPQEIIGVMKDFHFRSLRQTIEPVIFFHLESEMWGDQRMALIKYQTTDLPALISKIQDRWSSLAAATPFAFFFYDEELKSRYEQELRLGRLFSIFTGLSITIAVIGLVGLAAYSAEQRKKEIGIRKVFGASLIRVYVMMNRQYIKLIILAVFIATPVTWMLMQQWLDRYSYRIDINPWVFVFAGMAEVVFALCCVGYIALRAATLNPAAVLKAE